MEAALEVKSKLSETKETQKSSLRHTSLTVLGAILCVILIPILVLNISLIVKSCLHRDEIPNIGGYLPLIVLTDSMYPEIQSGDLIFCHTAAPEEIKEGDVIAFFDPAGNGTSVVTHRVNRIIKEDDGSIAFETKGDANNAADEEHVPAEKLVGLYLKRIPGAGKAVMFMQTTEGLVLCVICPIILLVGYDVIRRRLYERSRKEDTEALLRELEELRAKADEREAKE